MHEQWSAVDAFFAERLAPSDAALDAVLAANAAAGLPPHDVSPLQGRFLEILVRMIGARRVLEIGTLGGYSTIWMARGLPAGGESSRSRPNRTTPRWRATTSRAPASPTGSSCAKARRSNSSPRSYARRRSPSISCSSTPTSRRNPEYLAFALALTRAGSVIVGDNVVRDGAVVDAGSADPRVEGVRRFADLLAAEPRLVATALQTVGAKGWDGFAMALVVEPGPTRFRADPAEF